jgi:hypothetical protein
VVRAAATAAVHPTAVTCAARRRAPMKAAAATTTVEPTAATTASVKATAASATAMTATTTLRERSWGAKQRHGSKCSEENLETSGPNHVCYLHPTTSPTMRAAGTSKPFYTI